MDSRQTEPNHVNSTGYEPQALGTSAVDRLSRERPSAPAANGGDPSCNRARFAQRSGTMKLCDIPFQAIDWSRIVPTKHHGESGVAMWRTVEVGNVRARIVEYSPGYVADHWCERGHVLYVIEGELVNELRDGRSNVLSSGQGYVVADGDGAHRSKSPRGARLFIVD